MINIDIFPNSHKARARTVEMVILVAALPIVAFSGFEKNGRGTRAIAMANAFVAIADDPWAVFYNPAGLARTSSIQAAAFFSPAPFGMSELRTVCAGTTLPLKLGTAALVIDQSGFDLYKETTGSVAFGAWVNEWISLGLTSHFNRLEIKGYGSSAAFVFDVGGLASLTEDIRVGWCWKNCSQATAGSRCEELPQIFCMGVCYEITGDSRLSVELDKDIRHAIIKEFGYEQHLFDVLDVRLGISDNPDKCSFGIGIRKAGCEFSYAGYSHQQLGWTHQVELSVSLSP